VRVGGRAPQKSQPQAAVGEVSRDARGDKNIVESKPQEAAGTVSQGHEKKVLSSRAKRDRSVGSNRTSDATSSFPDANATDRRSTRKANPDGYDHAVLEEVNASRLTPARPTTRAVVHNDLFPRDKVWTCRIPPQRHEGNC
jgi:hypothetical protein